MRLLIALDQNHATEQPSDAAVKIEVKKLGDLLVSR
jgi:hypothetical protein